MPTVVRFDPYRISSDLELRIADPYDPTQEELDFRWNARPSEDELSLTFDLSGSEIPWVELRMDLDATLARSELEEILPPGVEPAAVATEARLVVSARCPGSRFRTVVELEPEEPGTWKGNISLRRASVRNVVELYPMLVRRSNVPQTSAQPGVALNKGSIIAEGRPIRLIVDASEPPLRNALDIKWEDFRTSAHPWLKDHAADIFFLDVDRPEPRLWLNSRYAALKAALHGHQAAGPEAIVRHLANGLIAQAVWLQLLIGAIGSIETDEELGTVEYGNPWAKNILVSFLPRLLPELADDDRLREVSSRFRSASQAAALIAQLGTLVQEHVPTYRLVEDAIRAGERMS
jgi:hypothetical protein